MAPGHLILLGSFHTPPQYNFLTTLLPDWHLQHVECCSALPAEALTETPNDTLIITAIDWLDSLREAEWRALQPALHQSRLWLGVADQSGQPQTTLQQWLSQGMDWLLPPRFEPELLPLLTTTSSARRDSAVLVGAAAAAAAAIPITDWLSESDYRYTHLPPGYPLDQYLQRHRTELVIALDKAAIEQLKLALYSVDTSSISWVALTDAKDEPAPFLPDPIVPLPNQEIARLPQLLQQNQPPQRLLIQRRNQRHFQRIYELLRVLGDNALISHTNKAGKILRANQRFCQISGYSEQELLGRTHRMIKSDLHPGTFFKSMWQRLTDGKAWHGLVCNRNKQGQLYWISTRMFPIADAQGVIDTYICISSDISALQQDRANLQHLTELLQFERSSHASWHCELSSGAIYISSRAAELFDRTFSRPPSLTSLTRVIEPADRLPALQRFNRALRSGQPFTLELRLRIPDKPGRWFEIKGYPVQDEAGQAAQVQGVIRAIETPSHYRIDPAVDTSLFRQLFDASDHCMAISDADGYILFTNPAFQHTMGFSATELQGRPCHELISNDHQTGCELTQRLLKTAQPLQCMTTRRRKDGSTFTAANLFGPIRDQAGRVTHLFSIFSDVSSEVVSQQALSADRDAALQTSRAKSDFMASLGHELRTPMNAILGYAQLLEQDPALDLQQQEQIQAILSAGRHLLEVVNNILDLSRIEAGKISLSYQQADLHELIAACIALLNPLAEERQISIEQSDLSACRLTTDPLRLKQILLNLISNALLYTPAGGSVRLQTHQPSPDRLQISISDNGPGIPAEHQRRIFEPYERLQSQPQTQPGSGMGLAICQQLTTLMGGQIGVDSSPGHGARFWIELPILATPALPTHPVNHH